MSYANPAYLIEPADLESRVARGEVRVFDATVFLERAEVGYRPRAPAHQSEVTG